jgi:hypothetical protein
MAKNKISEWSATAANNTDIGGIDIAEGCAPSGINNAIRELMAQVKDQQTGTDADNFTVGGNLSVTGTTTMTGVATAPTASSGTNTTQVATTAFTTTAIAAALQVIYPVGCIFTATVSTNPNTLFGFGTWVAFGEGRVLIGVGTGFTAGATGGSADAVVVSHTHTATVTDAGHFHDIGNDIYQGSIYGTVSSGAAARNLAGYGNPPNSTNSGKTNTTTTGVTVANSTTGVSATNANLQPYVVVYMWQRTA